MGSPFSVVKSPRYCQSAPSLIHTSRKYWTYLLRTSFEIDESKFRLQVLTRFDQDGGSLEQFWIEVTGITKYIKTYIDVQSKDKPTLQPAYKGICKVYYHDLTIRRYLDALAHGLMARAVGAGRG